jgi:hypothetical protein
VRTCPNRFTVPAESAIGVPGQAAAGSSSERSEGRGIRLCCPWSRSDASRFVRPAGCRRRRYVIVRHRSPVNEPKISRRHRRSHVEVPSPRLGPTRQALERQSRRLEMENHVVPSQETERLSGVPGRRPHQSDQTQQTGQIVHCRMPDSRKPCSRHVSAASRSTAWNRRPAVQPTVSDGSLR